MLFRIVACKQAFVQKTFAVPDVVGDLRILLLGAESTVFDLHGNNLFRERASSVNVLFKSGTKRMLSSGISNVPLTEERESALYDSHEARSFGAFKPQSLHLFMARERRSSINRHLPSRELPALRLYLT